MFPRALSQWTRAFFLWTAIIIFFAMLTAMLWALWSRSELLKKRPSHVLVSRQFVLPCAPPDWCLLPSGRRFAMLTASAYALNDGYTPSDRAADGRLVSVGTLAVSPDIWGALRGKYLCLTPAPRWLQSARGPGCGIVRDLTSPQYQRTVDIFAPSIALAREWGRRRVVVNW